MAGLPKPLLRFCEDNLTVGRASQALGKACAEAGPLDGQARELVKLGMAIGARPEGAVHAPARGALVVGCTPEQGRHVVALAAPALGFPTPVAAFTWVEETLARARPARRQGRP